MTQSQGFESEIFQRAWVVDDIQKAIHHWVNVHGVGPFFLSSRIHSQQALYLGRPASFEISAAIAQAGDVQIELIQQHAATCPLFGNRTNLPQGLHHVGIAVRDLEAIVDRYAAMGLPPCFEDSFNETRYVFIDTRAERGYLMEFVQDTASFNQTRAIVRDAAAQWNGDAAIRSFVQT